MDRSIKWTLQKELFAREIFRGVSTKKAYQTAFPDEAWTDRKAQYLKNSPEVRKRLAELEQAVCGTVNMENFLKEVQALAFTPLDPEKMRYADKLRALELLAKVLGFDRAGTENDIEDTAAIDEQVLHYRGTDDD